MIDMSQIILLVVTLLVGAFFLVGMAITKLTNKKEKLALFSIGLSFMVMMGMILIDIIPEIQESFEEVSFNQKWLLITGFTLIGIVILKGLDLLIPHHHHQHKENETNKKEHNDHLFHIGFVTSLSLILHNIMEGISIYATGITNFSTGALMALAVSLHNIPLGIEIAVGLESSKSKIKGLILFCLTISSFLGAFLIFVLNQQMNELVLSGLLCITFGMLIYIALFELLKEIWNNRKSKSIYYGIGLGIIINIIMVVL